eukprot:CAMPEP_0119278956 /NCGR_PEP_ID=MMETSP1329-20130426/19983_1 /TAXON_ID=114041 /ORGANISM="Genus nov. species nov., Strain RCC1024" /LENGTH=81 /DNA_ID=CAMNT_0007279485 /DNA_START=20 /DNA_END=261 /DNA_ORIENTATION=+
MAQRHVWKSTTEIGRPEVLSNDGLIYLGSVVTIRLLLGRAFGLSSTRVEKTSSKLITMPQEATSKLDFRRQRHARRPLAGP